MVDMDRVPRDKPAMLLPNHQNALLDPLIVAALAKARRPYFLTRSDVFTGGFLQNILESLRMIPIYRIRDGRDTLHRNEEIFDRCADLLNQGEHLLLFPEANHNLGRRVRTLSKGFTRIAINALEKYPETDLQLIPVGINFQRGADFPDRVTYRFGHPLPAAAYVKGVDFNEDSKAMKAAVSASLKVLTTHVPEDQDYEQTMERLGGLQPDFSNPDPINAWFENPDTAVPKLPLKKGLLWKLWDVIFKVVNLPLVAIWKVWVKPKVWEPEFMSTFRFGFALITAPIYLILLGVLFGIFTGWITGIAVPAGVFLHNILYIKLR